MHPTIFNSIVVGKSKIYKLALIRSNRVGSFHDVVTPTSVKVLDTLVATIRSMQSQFNTVPVTIRNCMATMFNFDLNWHKNTFNFRNVNVLGDTH